jgi:uncharacterized protein (TIGR03083 family)
MACMALPVAPLVPQREVGRDEIVRGNAMERRKTLALLRDLEPAEWDTATALPGWRIREVTAHLVTTDKAAVTGLLAAEVFTSMARLERWNEGQVPKWANRPIPELLTGLEAWGRRFARFTSLAPRLLLRLRLPTAWGRAPASIMFRIRAYDEWIHRQDIRRALGRPDERVNLAHVIELLFVAIESHTVPQLETAGTIRLDVQEVPVPLMAWSIGDPSDPQPQATIHIPGPELVMAAAGRNTFQGLEVAGTLTIDGDRALAERFLGLLRIV